MIAALHKRHDFFAEQGCKLSDHGIEEFYAEDYTDAEIKAIFNKVYGGIDVSQARHSTLKGEKLGGHWHLVRMAGKEGETRENWLLIKGEDEAAYRERVKSNPDAVRVKIEDLRHNSDRRAYLGPMSPFSTRKASKPAMV